jgi:chemotaxis methyl-accepting protein methylase
MIQHQLERMTRLKVLGKSPTGAYLRFGEWSWGRLPQSWTTLGPAQAYGRLMNTLVRLQANRTQYHGTFFFRNRPELELICRLARLRGGDSSLRIAVVACSNGAEAYSIMSALRSSQPSMRVVMQAMDISREVVEAARGGVYSFGVSKLVNEAILDRLTEDEVRKMFDRDGQQLRVKSWIKEGIAWHVGDAFDPEIVDTLGRQDLVVANRFLCHMEPLDAERCLRNIARLVNPGGYLFVSGVDLDVRTKVAKDLGWKPVDELREEIHDGDQSLRVSWPWKYWGLEPLDKTRHDWKVRYTSAFQLVSKAEEGREHRQVAPEQVAASPSPR